MSGIDYPVRDTVAKLEAALDALRQEIEALKERVNQYERAVPPPPVRGEVETEAAIRAYRRALVPRTGQLEP